MNPRPPPNQAFEPVSTHPDATPDLLIADARYVAQTWTMGLDLHLQLDPREADWQLLNGLPYPPPQRLVMIAQQAAHHVGARTILRVRLDGHEPHALDVVALEGNDYRLQPSLLRRLARLPTLLRRLGCQGAFTVARVARTAAEKRALHDQVLAGRADGLWFRPRNGEPVVAGPVFLRRETITVRVDRRDPARQHAVLVEALTPARRWQPLGSVDIPPAVALPASCTWVQVNVKGLPSRFLDPRFVGSADGRPRVAQLPLATSWGDADHG